MIEGKKKKESGGISRREFLKDAACLLVGGAALGSAALLSACGGGGTTTGTTTGTATKPETILYYKACHQWAVDDVRDKMIKAFGNMLKERTDGWVELYYYPNQALYKARETWDALRTGALDMAVLPLDYASGKVPELSITLMPCMLTNAEQGLTWKDKSVGYELDRLMLEDYGVRHVVWAWADGAPGSKISQIILPPDMNDHKLRAAGRKFEYMCIQAGATISSIPSSEIYHALATGVLDSAFTSSASWITFRLYEQVKYLNVPLDNCVWFMEQGIYISEKKYNKMTDWQKQIFNECAQEIQNEWVPKNFTMDTQRVIELFGQAGVELYYMTQEEWNTWYEYAQQTSWKHFVEDTPNGQWWLDMAIEASK